jgi:hypothetical protein
LVEHHAWEPEMEGQQNRSEEVNLGSPADAQAVNAGSGDEWKTVGAKGRMLPTVPSTWSVPYDWIIGSIEFADSACQIHAIDAVRKGPWTECRWIREP